jgi:hypothetical protein
MNYLINDIKIDIFSNWITFKELERLRISNKKTNKSILSIYSLKYFIIKSNVNWDHINNILLYKINIASLTINSSINNNINLLNTNKILYLELYDILDHQNNYNLMVELINNCSSLTNLTLNYLKSDNKFIDIIIKKINIKETIKYLTINWNNEINSENIIIKFPYLTYINIIDRHSLNPYHDETLNILFSNYITILQNIKINVLLINLYKSSILSCTYLKEINISINDYNFLDEVTDFIISSKTLESFIIKQIYSDSGIGGIDWEVESTEFKYHNKNIKSIYIERYFYQCNDKITKDIDFNEDMLYFFTNIIHFTHINIIKTIYDKNIIDIILKKNNNIISLNLPINSNINNK